LLFLFLLVLERLIGRQACSVDPCAGLAHLHLQGREWQHFVCALLDFRNNCSMPIGTLKAGPVF
jgi:hypothetical protein